MFFNICNSGVVICWHLIFSEMVILLYKGMIKFLYIIRFINVFIYGCISYCSFAVQRHHDQSNLKKESIYLGICLQFRRVNSWPSWWGTRQLAWRHGAGAISENLHPDTKVECRESETGPDVVLWNLSRNHIQKFPWAYGDYSYSS